MSKSSSENELAGADFRANKVLNRSKQCFGKEGITTPPGIPEGAGPLTRCHTCIRYGHSRSFETIDPKTHIRIRSPPFRRSMDMFKTDHLPPRQSRCFSCELVTGLTPSAILYFATMVMNTGTTVILTVRKSTTLLKKNRSERYGKWAKIIKESVLRSFNGNNC